jgi:hypothetical protein
VDVVECIVYTTIFIIVPKKILVMGQANHHLYMLANDLAMIANFHDIH